MKKPILFSFLLFSNLIFSQVGINTSTPHPSAVLDVNSTTKGVLLPKMTETQRNNIVAPGEGLMVYNLDSKCFQTYKGGVWSKCLGQQSSTLNMSCTSVNVNGNFIKDQPLNASNTITLSVFVTSSANYEIVTNTINGYSFFGSGTLVSGVNNITLYGSGTPINNQNDVFTISFMDLIKTCSATVMVSLALPNCLAYKNAGNNTNGQYNIDPDGIGGSAPFLCYCDMTNDGGGWTLVFKQDHTTGGVYASDAQADQFDITNLDPINAGKYSILFKIDVIKNAAAYEFRLNYPNLGKRNHWTQTFNPRSAASTTNPVAGYNPIAISMNTAGWGGLNLSNNNDTYIDGNPNSGNWFYSIGTQIIWPNASGGSPADTNSPEKIIQLFIR